MFQKFLMDMQQVMEPPILIVLLILGTIQQKRLTGTARYSQMIQERMVQLIGGIPMLQLKLEPRHQPIDGILMD
jgi:hypothetical protein